MKIMVGATPTVVKRWRVKSVEFCTFSQCLLFGAWQVTQLYGFQFFFSSHFHYIIKMFEDIKKKNHYLQFLKIIFKIIKKSLSNKVTHDEYLFKNIII